MMSPIFIRASKRGLVNLNALVNSTTRLRYLSDDKSGKPKTLQFQDQLGQLPVPDLNETMARFLKTAQPHLTEQEFKGTMMIFRELSIEILAYCNVCMTNCAAYES